MYTRNQKLVKKLTKEINNYSEEPFYQGLLIGTLNIYSEITSGYNISQAKDLDKTIEILKHRFPNELGSVKQELEKLSKEMKKDEGLINQIKNNEPNLNI